MTRVRLVHPSKLFGRFDDCNRLYGNWIPKTFAFPINNAGDEDIAPHTVCLGRLDHSIIGIESLIQNQRSVSL